MTRGIIYTCWGSDRLRGNAWPRSALAELYFAVRSAGCTGLPICLFLDHQDTRVDESLFSQVIRVDFHGRETRFSDIFNRKTYALLHSPFDETLYLDADTQILDPALDYAFDKLPRHGWCMALDGWTFGQMGPDNQDTDHSFKPMVLRLLSPQTGYVPLYNGGMIFFAPRHPQARRVMEMADRWCVEGYEHEGIRYKANEQGAYVIAAELLRHPPFLLDNRIWNCRDNHLGKPVFQKTKILHAFRAVKTYCDEHGMSEDQFVACQAEREIV